MKEYNSGNKCGFELPHLPMKGCVCRKGGGRRAAAGPAPDSEESCASRSSAGPCGRCGAGCRAVSGAANMERGGRGGLL